MKSDSMREVLDLLNTGIMLADVHGRVSYANRAAMAFLDIEEPRFSEISIDRLMGKESDKREAVLSTRNNERLTLRMSKTPLERGGYLVMLTDITEIHKLQQELLRMDKLASVGELTSGIAHEIRNPLAGIKTTAQALDQELAPNDHRKPYVSRIIAEIDRLNKLLLNFFDFARPRALNVRPCDLKKVIEDAVYMVQDAAREHHVQVIEFFPSGKTQIQADSGMIQQVLINVLLNAIQAIDSPGRVEITLADKKSHCMITVKDSGRGIPEHVKSRIFDPFFTTKPKGIGLGLSISYRIVKMHSGSISFVSSHDGTSCTITLPKEMNRLA
ncbi:MAG: ATP-binding protein [Desulfomonilia bacterium]|nr:ATP-binding protein [Desulfomonilia bacterium]